MVRPGINVVVPVWNEIRVIEKTIGSIEAAIRAWGNATLVVVDNGSTDGTWEVLQRLTQSVPMTLVQQPSASIGALRNRGASLGAGELISFIDADCLIPADYFNQAWRVLEQTGATATGSPAAPPNPPNPIEDIWFRLHDRDEDGPVRYLGAANLVLRRAAFEAVGGFDPTLRTGEDAELAMRLRAAGHTIHRARAVSASHLGNPRTLRDFCRRQWWHGLGTVRPIRSFDRPFLMSMVHLVLSLTGLAWFIRSPGILSFVFWIVGLLAVPALTVAARMRSARRSVPLARAVGLYWLYYGCRLAAFSTLLVGWPPAPRGWKAAIATRVTA
jgi:glycosyltransferase involved in cell wall biosynthesis